MRYGLAIACIFGGLAVGAPSSASATVYYETDFNKSVVDSDNDNQPDGWTAQPGTAGNPGWRIEPDGEYRYDDTSDFGRSEYTGAFDPAHTFNYVISAEFRRDSNLTGLVARSNGGGDFYHARLYDDDLQIYRFDDGATQLLATTQVSQPYSNYNETWRIELSTLGRGTATQVTARVLNASNQIVGAARFTDAAVAGFDGNASGNAGVRAAGTTAYESFTIAAPLTLTATDDAYVEYRSDQPDSANSTHGSGTIQVKSANQPGGSELYRKAYLKFDLNSVGQTIYSASLDMEAFQGNGSNTLFQIYGLRDGIDGDGSTDWTDDNLTWNNAPGNDAGNTLSSDATFLGTMLGVDAEATIDVASFTSDALLEFLNSDTNGLVTLIVLAKDTTDVFTSPSYYFTGTESGNGGPALSLVTIPEPTAGLVLIGALTAGMMTRRRL